MMYGMIAVAPTSVLVGFELAADMSEDAVNPAAGALAGGSGFRPGRSVPSSG